MDPNYKTIVDFNDLIWDMVAYALHGGIVFLHISLAGFLLGTGIHNLLLPGLDGAWLRRLGAIGIGLPRTRVSGAVRITLGVLLLAPIAMSAPMGASLIAGMGAVALLLVAERRAAAAERPRGRLVRHAAIVFAAVTSVFMVWEGEDNLVLGADLLIHSMEWRSEEIDWQNSLDPKSPKLGELAPDFELQDPEGNVRGRLSDFRGSRPVALVFGSYT